MGTSTDAILFYGYCWDDEDVRYPWALDGEDDAENGDEDDDWEARYARTKGCLPPSAPFPDREVPRTKANGWNSTPKDYSAAEQAIIDQHRAYWKAKRKIVEASACVVNTHCSASCPMAYVAVSTSLTISHRGSPSEIAALTVDPVWKDQLAEFCKTMDIKTKGKKAAWWLVSDWSE